LGVVVPTAAMRAAREANQLVQVVVTVALAEGGIDEVGPAQAIAVAVVGVLQTIHGRASGAFQPALIDNPAEAVQAGVRVARVAVGFAGSLDVAQIDARLRVLAGHHHRLAQVVVALQHPRAVRQRRQAADGVIQPGRVVVVEHPAVGVDDAGESGVVGPAGHLAVGVLHPRRAASHNCGVLLPFADQLAQAVEVAFHLVDDVAAGGRVVAGDQGQVPQHVIAVLDPPHGTIHARPQRRDGVGHEPTEHVVAQGVDVAVAVGQRDRFTQGVLLACDYDFRSAVAQLEGWLEQYRSERSESRTTEAK